jgi:hypothetical protein
MFLVTIELKCHTVKYFILHTALKEQFYMYRIDILYYNTEFRMFTDSKHLESCNGLVSILNNSTSTGGYSIHFILYLLYLDIYKTTFYIQEMVHY